MSRETDEDRYREFRHFSQYLTIPLVLLVTPLVGWYLGRLLDRVFHTGDVLSIIFLFMGFIAGGVEIYRILARAGREDRAAREKRERGDGT